MLAVLARGYDWQVDVNEPLKHFPLPSAAVGCQYMSQCLKNEHISLIVHCKVEGHGCLVAFTCLE